MKLKTNKPANGIDAYVWRMVRFHSGADVTLPMTAAWGILRELKTQGFQIEHKDYYGAVENEILKTLDYTVDAVMVELKLNPYKGVLRWKGLLY